MAHPEAVCVCRYELISDEGLWGESEQVGLLDLFDGAVNALFRGGRVVVGSPKAEVTGDGWDLPALGKPFVAAVGTV